MTYVRVQDLVADRGEGCVIHLRDRPALADMVLCLVHHSVHVVRDVHREL